MTELYRSKEGQSLSKIPMEVLGWQQLVKETRTSDEVAEHQDSVTKPEEWLFFHTLVGDLS